MRKLTLATGMIGVAIACAPVLAQDAGAGTGSAGTMSATDVGAQPMTGTSSTNYVAWAADSDMYDIQSSQLALSKAKSDGIKQFAREMVLDYKTSRCELPLAFQ
jgi:putative membrane protein